MTLEIVPATFDQAMALRPEGLDEGQYRGWMTGHFQQGPVWAGVTEGGALVGCSGLSFLWPGVAMGWAIFDPPALRNYRLTVIRTYRAWIPELMRQHGIQRLHTHVYDDQVLIRWIEVLGFKREGLMRKYGPGGQDCWMCSIIRGGYDGSVDT